MKKHTYILLPFLALSSVAFSGCKKDPVEEPKVNLSYGDVHAEKVTEIIGADLYQKIKEDKENLMMVVSAVGCSCWDEFQDIINQYVKENKLICYHVSYDEFSVFAASCGLVLNKSTTTFAVFEEGNLKFNIHTDPDTTTMTDYPTFKKTLDATISKPHCYFVNEQDVDAMMASDKSEVVYFERNGCPDCTYINKSILKDYVKSHQDMNNLYILDCQSWLTVKEEQGDEAYQALKDKYGLSTANNPDFGYNNGSFPFFSLIENGQYKAGAEAYNEKVAKYGNNVIVESSYYSDERVAKLPYRSEPLDRLVLNEGTYSTKEREGVTYYSWNKPSATEYYRPLINSFLNYSLAKVTYSF